MYLHILINMLLMNQVNSIIAASSHELISKDRLFSKSTRSSYKSFFLNRNWDVINKFWGEMLMTDNLPPFIIGDSKIDGYGINSIDRINKIGIEGEFKSKDLRYIYRKTYAMRIGYLGTEFNGYAKQTGIPTVEGDLKKALNRAIVVAGRTDRDVSAVSQIINFVSSTNETEEDFVNKVNDLMSSQKGHLKVYDCQRVPRKFNARSQATWRRYVYLFPLNGDDVCGYDVDVSFLNECLQKIVNISLPYGSLSYREKEKIAKTNELSSKDFCTILKASAELVDLNKYMSENFSDNQGKSSSTSEYLKIIEQLNSLSDELDSYQSELDLIRMNLKKSVESLQEDEQALLKEKEKELSSYVCDLANSITNIRSTLASFDSGSKVVCIELVGSRFLRKMVRIIAGTVCRESSYKKSEKDVNVLLNICNKIEGAAASSPLPGFGLALCGVGFDYKDLCVYKFMPKVVQEDMDIVS